MKENLTEKQSNLRRKPIEPYRIESPEKTEIFYIPEFYSVAKANEYFDYLKNGLAWEQHSIKLFGKIYTEPRLIAWLSEKDYTYSGKRLVANGMDNEVINGIVKQIGHYCDIPFNSVLCNYYRNGNDSMGWHRDNETELGEDPSIASVSFGLARTFVVKSENERFKYILENGSLLIMGKGTQLYSKHSLPKTKQVGERINLTFRYIL